MSLFAEILCKQFPNIKYPNVNNYSIYQLTNSYKYDKIYYNAIKLIYNIYFLPYKTTLNNKFNIFNVIILKNDNINEFEKNFFINEFSKAQKTYSAFRNLAIIYKFKYYKKFEIDMDLCFNKFSNLNNSILITLLENNLVYKFRLSDLINITNKSLSHAPIFFAEPYEIRNPYTNLPFSLANLYNIYFKLKNSTMNMPILFYLYFLSDFSLEKFRNENECFIRDKYIDSFVKIGSINEHYEYIMKMFYTYHNYIYFTLHPLFPKKTVVKVFKKYLKSYLLREYSLNPYIREKNHIHLEYKLALFSQLNPEFGKKVYIRKRRNNQIHLYYYFNENIIESSNITNNPSRFESLFLNRMDDNNDINNDNVDDNNSDNSDNSDNNSLHSSNSHNNNNIYYDNDDDYPNNTDDGENNYI
jgi:hypothetical protein